MDYRSILDKTGRQVASLLYKGKVAECIPAPAEADPGQSGMSLTPFDGSQYGVGDSETLFSIRSISKVFTFTLALSVTAPISIGASGGSLFLMRSVKEKR